MGGIVTSNKINLPSGEYHPEGLMSEQIFGPKSSFRCQCGKLSSQLDANKICPKCNVECCSNDKRLTEFANIEFVFPVIKPTKKKYFNKIVGNNNKQLLDPIKADAAVASKRYLAIKASGDELKIVNELKDMPNYFIVPLRITGLYSFLLALRFVAERMNLDVAKTFFEESYIIKTIKVLPPDVRPIMRTSPKEIIVTEINKHYISLINLGKANDPLKASLEEDEKVWLDQIAMTFKLQQQGAYEEIVEAPILDYDPIAARYQYYTNRVYETVYETLSGKHGFIRSAILGRTIEFSARSVIRVDPSLLPWEVKVSKKILYKLWYPHFLRYLTTVKNWEYDECCKIENSEYEDMKEDFDQFLKWFCK